MKKSYSRAFLLLASTTYIAAASGHPGLTIAYIEPDSYADVSLSGSNLDKMRAHVLTTLEIYLHQLADTRLPISLYISHKVS